jgi:hypothetical protein
LNSIATRFLTSSDTKATHQRTVLCLHGDSQTKTGDKLDHFSERAFGSPGGLVPLDGLKSEYQAKHGDLSTLAAETHQLKIKLGALE